jgi:hypothetical protein
MTDYWRRASLRANAGDIDVKLGDALNRYKVEGKVGTFVETAEWLRDQAVRHYPNSAFARQFAVP